MLKIAIQAKGRLNEQSIELLAEAGIRVAESKRKLISRAEGFPLEVLYLRDDDIPQAVSMGVADLGIVGLNEVAEKGFDVEEVLRLGFGTCRLSLAAVGVLFGNVQILSPPYLPAVMNVLITLPITPGFPGNVLVWCASRQHHTRFSM